MLNINYNVCAIGHQVFFLVFLKLIKLKGRHKLRNLQYQPPVSRYSQHNVGLILHYKYNVPMSFITFVSFITI